MKKILSKLLSVFGFEYQIVGKKYFGTQPGNLLTYGMIKSTAGYSPWLQDKRFQETYNIIKGFTLVDIYRCYELWSIIDEVCKIDEKAALLEVGVWRGGTSGLIAKKLELLHPEEILYAADTFEGVVKSTQNDSSYIDGEHSDTDVFTVEKLFTNTLGLKNIRILQGIFPEATKDLIPADTKFRFCHIDVDVYKSAEDVVDWIWDKMVNGGIIVFDDYGFISCDGITKFVNERKKNKDCVFIYNINGHAILIKK